jgi:hypothetical protein
MDSKEIRNRIRLAGVPCNPRFNVWLLNLTNTYPILNRLKWWLILTFPSKWGSRYLSYLHERPPFNDCLFDYDEVWAPPCSIKEYALPILYIDHEGQVRCIPNPIIPDFGGYQIKTGREYVPKVAMIGAVTEEGKDDL